jgi:hypothetical protein
VTSPRLLRATAIGGVLLAAVFLSVRAASFYGLAPGGARRHHVEAAAFIFSAAAALSLLATRRAPERAREPRALPLAALLVLAFGAFAYGSWALPLGFLSDDFVLLARAVDGRYAPTADWPYFRPLPLLLWRAVASISDSPYWFHTLNAAFHAANAVLVCAIATRLGLTGISPFVAGALFALWPAHLEAVAWASGVQDLLMTFGALLFLLGAFACRWMVAVAGLVVAISSKETGVTAPLIAALLWVSAPRDRRPCTPIVIAGFAFAGAYTTLRLAFAAASTPYATGWPSGYFLKELVGRPIAALAVPIASGLAPDWAVLAGASLFVLVALVCAAVLLGSWTGDERALSLRLVAAIPVTILPVYSLLHISPLLEGSRYVYLASACWSLLLALLGQTLARASGSLALGARVLLSFLLISWGFAYAWHRPPWWRAAELRDLVLRSATDAAAQCQGEALFAGAPDSIDGAYVFRNGLPEAVAREPSARAVPSIAARPCLYVWDGERFVLKR